MAQNGAPRSLATNGVYSAASEVSIILLFVLLIIAARELGDEQFGVFSFALAFVNVMGFIMEGGLSFVYTRIVSRDPTLAKRYMGNVVTLQLLFCAAGIAVVVAILALLDQPAETETVVYLLAVAEGLRFLKYLFRFAFRTADRFELETLSVYIERVLLLGLSIGLMVAGYGVVGFAWAFVITRVIDLTITIGMFARSVFSPSLRFEVALWPSLVRQSFPFILTAAVVMMLYKVDSVILSLVHTDAEVGWYNAAYRLIEGFYLFPKILSNVLYPRLSEVHRDHDSVIELYGRAIKYVFMIAVPLTFIGAAASEDVILLLYGPEYQNATIALQILLFSLVFLFIYEVSFTLLGALDRQRVFFYFSAFSLVLNILLNILLIPTMSYVGAGIATVVSQMVFAWLISIYLKRIGYGLPYFQLALQPLLAAIPMALIAHYFLDSFFVIAPVTVAGYFILLTIMRYWDAVELEMAQNMLGRVRGLVSRRVATQELE